MKPRTAESVIELFEQNHIFEASEFTYEEYVNELFGFQRMASEIVFGKTEEVVRISDTITHFEMLGRENNLHHHSEFRQAISGLKKVEKELAISMSGSKGEDRIVKTLGYANRSDMRIYRNVYVTDGVDETEIDCIVVTNKGIIIFEVKNAKNDITIAEDGRILYENEISYHNVSIGDKMEKKRRLLRSQIETASRSKGLDIPIHIDSYVVFSTPYKVYIRVNDLFRKEKYCFKSQLVPIVEEFTSHIYYGEVTLDCLHDIMNDLESNKKRFETNIKFFEVINDFAKAVELLTMDTKYIDATGNSEGKPVEPVKENESNKKQWVFIKPLVASAALFTTAAVVTAAILGFGRNK